MSASTVRPYAWSDPVTPEPSLRDPRSHVVLLIGIFAAQFGIFAALMAPALVTLALRIASVAPSERNLGLSLVLSTGALCAMIGNPIFGALSDRTRSRLGRRRPWILGGFLIGSLGLFMLSGAGSVPALVLGWSVTQLGFNAATAAVVALLSDLVPSRLRGRFASVLGIGQYCALAAAAILVTLASGNVFWEFMLPATVALAGVTVLLVAVREQTPLGIDQRPFAPTPFLRGFWVSPRRSPDYAWAWLSRFFKTAAQFTFTSYQTFFLIDRYGFSLPKVAGYVALSTVVSTVLIIASSAVCGWLSDRVGRRKIFVWAAAGMVGVGLALMVVHVPFGIFLIFVGLIGAAQGTYAAVDLALVLDVLPDKNSAAKDLGVMNIAGTLPQSLLPAVAPMFLAIGGGGANYEAFFLAGAICAGLGALFIVFIKGVR